VVTLDLEGKGPDSKKTFVARYLKEGRKRDSNDCRCPLQPRRGGKQKDEENREETRTDVRPETKLFRPRPTETAKTAQDYKLARLAQAKGEGPAPHGGVERGGSQTNT